MARADVNAKIFVKWRLPVMSHCLVSITYKTTLPHQRDQFYPSTLDFFTQCPSNDCLFTSIQAWSL